MLLYAGLRRSEAVALKWADIDFEAGLLTVRHGKGNKERTIGFASDKAREYLRRWRTEIPTYTIDEDRSRPSPAHNRDI